MYRLLITKSFSNSYLGVILLYNSLPYKSERIMSPLSSILISLEIPILDKNRLIKKLPIVVFPDCFLPEIAIIVLIINSHIQ